MYIKRNEAKHTMKNIMFEEVFIAGMEGFFLTIKKKKVTQQINRLEENKQTECFNRCQKGNQVQTCFKRNIWKNKNKLEREPEMYY